MEDRELLRRYVVEKSEASMSAIVERHIKMVYAVARRETSDVTMAEDVTQAVFIILAQKAARLPESIPLAAWLFTVTRYAANNARRGEKRRRIREKRVVDEMKRQISYSDADAWKLIEPELNDALAALSNREREVIFLRYFRDLSIDEIGQALAITSKAAQMRILRATEKLRAILARRGAELSVTVMIAVLLDKTGETMPGISPAQVAHTALDPVHLLSQRLPLFRDISNAPSHTHGTTIQSIVQGATRSMSIQSLKATTAVVLAAIVGTSSIVFARRTASQNTQHIAAASTSSKTFKYFKPTEINLFEIDRKLTVDGEKLRLINDFDRASNPAVWSAPYRPHIKLTIRSMDGQTSIVDETGATLWAQTFPQAASTDFVMSVDRKMNATIISRNGEMIWSGSVANPQDPNRPFIAPDKSSIWRENSGFQNNVAVSEWFFGGNRQFTYRVEHRDGFGKPAGDYAFIKLAGTTPGSAGRILWEGKPVHGGIEVQGDSQVKVVGIPDYPINPTFTATYDINFTPGMAVVTSTTTGGKTVKSEPITIAHFDEAFTTTPAPANLAKTLSDACVPDNNLDSNTTGQADYRIAYKNGKGEVQQTENLSLSVTSRMTPGPDSRQYNQVEVLKRDIYDAAGNLRVSWGNRSYVLMEPQSHI